MGCSRETQSIFLLIKLAIKYKRWHEIQRAWYFLQHWNKTTTEDTFMPLICKIKGHIPYKPDMSDANEWACKRCHRYINQD